MPKISQTLKDSRREAIIQAALDCLEKHGLAGTSMRTIAEAVGLTKGGLYPYFENKEAILIAASERYLEEQLTLLQPRPGVAAAQQLDEFLDSFMLASLDPKIAAAQSGMVDLWLSAGNVPEVRASIEQRYDRYQEAIAALLRRGQDEGVFRRDADARQVAALMLATRDGLVFHRVKLALPIPLQELSTLMRTLVFDSLRVPGDARPATASTAG